jgi:ribosomal protein L19
MMVRNIQSGEDFVKVYGGCLTRNQDLKIKEIRPADGLMVTLLTEAQKDRAQAYNGFLTVNAGTGPVDVMIISYTPDVARP